jgi:putative addiction module component (TIGR02574 family)
MSTSHPELEIANPEVVELLEKARELPEACRADLAYHLLLSLSPLEPSNPDLTTEAAWVVEVERRCQDVDEDPALAIPWENVIKELRSSVRHRD